MQGPSRESLAQVLERVGTAARDTAPAELDRASDELFAVLALLDRQSTLRRTLSDPAVAADAKVALVDGLFASRLGALATAAMQQLVGPRWSSPRDLADAVEVVGVQLTLAAAESRGELDTVEDELFRFGRIVAGDQELSRILGDRSAPAAGKVELLDRLLAQRVTPATALLVRNELTASHVGNAEVAVERLSEEASRRRGQSVARVITAVALSAAQERRLTELLGRLYGRAIGLQVTVDPEILGGLVIRVGDEVIDGSIAHRLEAAGRRLAG